jgi:subtilisin family serine protease
MAHSLNLSQALIIALAAAFSFNPSAHSAEYIVRMRAPQNTQAEAEAAVLRAGFDSRSRVQIVNSEEGVLKIQTPGDSALKRGARARNEMIASEGSHELDAGILKVDSSVLRLTPNLRYRPAMHYSFTDVSADAKRSSFEALFSGPQNFVGFLRGAIPPVRSAPATIPGADPLSSRDYTFSRIGFSPASALQASGKVIAAVIDTGVDYNHEDLAAGMWRKPGSGGKEVGYDFAHDHARPFDLVNFDVQGCMRDPMCRDHGIGAEKYMSNPGHGTHCAGRVAAVGGNSKGLRGVGSGARIMALKFFADAGEPNAGQGDDAAAIQTIDYAIKNGAKVISASWGGRQSRSAGERSELKQALIRAQRAGVIVVIAAGNDGVNQDAVSNPSYPAAYDLDNLIVVAASDSVDELAQFSNYGVKSVHIAAPGVKILSTTSGGSYSDVVARYTDRSGREREMNWDGTSMATPTVAGAVALVWSQFPHEDYRQIRSRILSNARKVAGLSGRVASGGVLDIGGALKR